MLAFDTFAWMERLLDGRHGEAVEAMHLTEEIGTPVPVLAEISQILARHRLANADEILDAVLSTSEVLPVSAEAAIAAGVTRARLDVERRGIGLVDCMIYEAARAHGAELVTGDRHLRGLPGVRFLE